MLRILGFSIVFAFFIVPLEFHLEWFSSLRNGEGLTGSFAVPLAANTLCFIGIIISTEAIIEIVSEPEIPEPTLLNFVFFNVLLLIAHLLLIASSLHLEEAHRPDIVQWILQPTTALLSVCAYLWTHFVVAEKNALRV